MHIAKQKKDTKNSGSRELTEIYPRSRHHTRGKATNQAAVADGRNLRKQHSTIIPLRGADSVRKPRGTGEVSRKLTTNLVRRKMWSTWGRIVGEHPREYHEKDDMISSKPDKQRGVKGGKAPLAIEENKFVASPTVKDE